MKNLTTFLIGGIIMLAIAPYMGMLIHGIGTLFQIVGIYLQTFPSFF